MPAGTLPAGSYDVKATTPSGLPATAQGTVVAPAVPVLSPAPLPATVGPSDNVDLSGTLTNVPAGTTVTITITGPNGFTRTLTATTDGAGAYGPVPAGTLPAGDYTVTTTAAGVAPVAQTLAVRAAAGAGAVQAVPTLGTWALGLLGLLLAGVAGWRRRFE